MEAMAIQDDCGVEEEGYRVLAHGVADISEGSAMVRREGSGSYPSAQEGAASPSCNKVGNELSKGLNKTKKRLLVIAHGASDISEGCKWLPDG